MKKSPLYYQIQTEIKTILTEESAEDIKGKTSAQAELNKELEKTKELTTESLNPEVSRDVNRYIARTAKRYGYSEQDAVYAIMAALKQRDFDGLNEEEEMGDDEMDKKASKGAKKGDSVTTIANKLGETASEMKRVVNKWKKMEDGSEKEKLKGRLKSLSKIKKELEGLL